MLKQWQIDAWKSLDDWDQLEFTSPSEGANQKKQQLLEMARNGEPKPIQGKHPLGRVLCFYTNPNNSMYDYEFDKQIRKLTPDWFINTVDENKQKLLEMARNGDKKPSQKTHQLGWVLWAYTNPNNSMYDYEFDKQVRKLRPDWFINTVDEKKQQLLDMARNGEPRPNKKHPLGAMLGHYTNPNNSMYDYEFDKQIRKLRPDWFVLKSEIATQKRQQLLEIARNGKPRPNQKHPLVHVLGHYTSPSSKCYNAEFDKQIRKLRPDWFKK